MAQEANENEISVRPCWRDCDTQGDSEIFEIDKMEDSIAWSMV